jgi:hypothetical protein
MNNNDEKKNLTLKRIKELTKDMDDWPEWKKNINLTDASTFTVSTTSKNNYTKPQESDE